MFKNHGNASTRTHYNQLKEALAHTAKEIPWIGGVVQGERGSSAGRGRIEVHDAGLRVPFNFNDLSGPETDFPGYAALKAENFPLSQLPATQLAPVHAVPSSDNPPAFAAQANFIRGGLLLTICAHHSTCDGAGLNAVIQTWAHKFSAISLVESGALLSLEHSLPAVDPTINDRSQLMSGSPGATIDDFPEFIIAPKSPEEINTLNGHGSGPALLQHEIPELTSRVFKISTTSLATLKDAAGAYSSNDALTALVWRHVTLARHSASSSSLRHTVYSSTDATIDNNTGVVSLLAYAANVRAKFSPPLPPNYMGNATIAGITERLPISELLRAEGLTTAAAAIRTSVKNLASSPETLQRIIGLIDSQADPTELRFAYDAFLGPDVTASSLVDLDVYRVEWGTLGCPVAFRVPGDGGDGLMVVFPRLADGDVEFMVMLEKKAMERLLGDGEFRGWVEPWA